MSRKNKKQTENLSSTKRSIFNLILALISFVIILELLLRIVGYGDNLSLFINHPNRSYPEYLVVNPEIGNKYFQEVEYSHPAKDYFLKDKPDDVFRIFVMGSSTVAGFPYDNNLMFSRILSERLAGAYPDKKIEIVNTAISGINSSSLLDFMPQVLREKPDAILFYAGHSEFYGAFGAGSNEANSHNPRLIKIHLKMMNFRVYKLARGVVSGIENITRTSNTAKANRVTLMSRIVKNAEIIYGSELYNKGIEDYEINIELILALSHKKGVPVFISDVVSNLSGIQPFKSVETIDLEGAGKLFTQARRLESKKEFKAAYENYTKARDYDCIRLRASSDINSIIKKSALKNNAIFVPTLHLFESNSPNEIIGENLISDHIHPNINGEFLLSESFFKAIVDTKLIDEQVNIYTSKPYDYFFKHYGYSYLDYLVGKHRVKDLQSQWPFKAETNNFNDYRKIYKPSSFIDSLAFNAMVFSDKSLYDAHHKLAEKFEVDGDYINAFKEYNVLVRMEPLGSVNYRKAADCLLKLNDLKGALIYFEKSNIYEDSYSAHFHAGEINMIQNDLEMAIYHFEKAKMLSNKNERLVVLIKLYVAYSQLNEIQQAKLSFDEIKENKQDSKITVPPRKFTFLKYIPKQVQLQIDDADEFIEREDTIAAFESLLKSIQIYETPIANFKIGEIYFKNEEFEKSSYYFNKIYDDYKGDVIYLKYFIITNLENRKKHEAQQVLDQLKKIEPGYSNLNKLQEYIDNFSL